MPREIARLDESGMIVAVEECSPDDYRTDPISRSVQLEPGHDMRNKINGYRFNWHSGVFMPLSTEPMDIAERDTAELVDVIMDTIEDVTDYLEHTSPPGDNKFKVPARTKRVLDDFRRYRPRKAKRLKETLS